MLYRWIHKGEELNLDDEQISKLKEFKSSFLQWKNDSQTINSISDLIEKVSAGYNYRLDCVELQQLLEQLCSSLTWTAQALTLIRAYTQPFKSSFMTESQLSHVSQKLGLSIEKSDENVLTLSRLLQNANQTCTKTSEYKKLQELEQQSLAWKTRSSETVQKQEEQTENNIKSLLEESKHFPADP